MTNYIICSVRQISCCYGGLVKENEFGGACVRHGTDEKDMQIKVEEKLPDEDKVRGPNVHRKMILKCTKQMGYEMWTGKI